MPLRWPTVKWWAPPCVPTRAPAASVDRARPVALAAVLGQERGAAGAGEEAEVLRLALVARRPARPRRRARGPPAWCARRAGSAGGRAWPGSWPPACRPGPWPGRRPRAAARRRSCARSGPWRGRRRRARRRRRPSRPAAPGRCSARTGWASAPRRGRPATAGPRRHGTPSRRSSVKCGRPRPWATARAARTALRRAAGRLGVVVRVAPQLERDRDRLAALAGDQQRGHGGVHPAAHGDHRAVRLGRHGRVARARRRPAPGAARRRPGRRRAACPGSARRARRRWRAVPTRAACSTGAPATSCTAAQPAARAAPQPWASNPASATRSPSTRSAQLDEVAAQRRRRRCRRSGAVRLVPAARRVLEVLAQAQRLHAAETRGRWTRLAVEAGAYALGAQRVRHDLVDRAGVDVALSRCRAGGGRRPRWPATAGRPPRARSARSGRPCGRWRPGRPPCRGGGRRGAARSARCGRRRPSGPDRYEDQDLVGGQRLGDRRPAGRPWTTAALLGGGAAFAVSAFDVAAALPAAAVAPRSSSLPAASDALADGGRCRRRGVRRLARVRDGLARRRRGRGGGGGGRGAEPWRPASWCPRRRPAAGTRPMRPGTRRRR